MKLGPKVNMCNISIVIHAVHHWAYESLMISAYWGHNYSTKDAALAGTVVLKPKSKSAGAKTVLKPNI